VISEDGDFVVDAPPGQVEVKANRTVGAYTLYSDPVIALAVVDEVVEVGKLFLPENKQGILGFGSKQTADGYVITGIINGSSADRAGLVAGNLILEVEGENFPAEWCADAGTVVEALIDRGEGPEIIELTYE
jgi:hypothetical protein